MSDFLKSFFDEVVAMWFLYFVVLVAVFIAVMCDKIKDKDNVT